MNEKTTHSLDSLDCNILNQLLKNSRKSFQEIARELVVSGGTIHVRVNKMKEAGIISGSKLQVDFSKLGLGVCSFIGINLNSAKDYQAVLKQLTNIDEVVEVYYTTGQYSLFVKVIVGNIKDFHLFLVEKLQSISQIQSTETFISLDNPINREPIIFFLVVT